MRRMPMTNMKITSSECRSWKGRRRWSPHLSLDHHRMVVVAVVEVLAAEDPSHVGNVDVAVTSRECVHLLLQAPDVAELLSFLECRVILVASVGNQAIGRKIAQTI